MCEGVSKFLRLLHQPYRWWFIPRAFQLFFNRKPVHISSCMSIWNSMDCCAHCWNWRNILQLYLFLMLCAKGIQRKIMIEFFMIFFFIFNYLNKFLEIFEILTRNSGISSVVKNLFLFWKWALMDCPVHCHTRSGVSRIGSGS